MRTVKEIDDHVSKIFSSAELAELDAIAGELAEIGSNEALALRAIVVGLTGYRREEVDLAMAACEEATVRYRELQDLRGMARAALNHGRLYHYIGDKHTARSKYIEAIDLYTQVDDPSRMLRARVNVGLVDRELGDIERALENLTACVSQAIALHDEHALGNTYLGIAHIYIDQDEYGQAIEYYRRAIEVYERNGEQSAVSNALNSIASIHFYVGDYVAAAELWHQVLDDAIARNAPNGMSTSLHNLGNLHDTFGEKEQALTCYERSREIGRTQQQHEVVLHAEQKIGTIYCDLGRADEGIALLEGCIAAYAQHGLDEDLVSASTSLAGCLLNLEQIDRVRELLASVERFQYSPSDKVGILRVRAELALRDQDPTSARDFLLEALSISEQLSTAPTIVQIHLDLRNVYKQLNDFEGYIRHNELWTKLNDEIKGTKVGQLLATQAAERRIAIERQEHVKNLAVLHSTLPKHIADRVSKGEQVNDHYDNAAVIFLDIVGFTELSSSMSSQEVIALLDDVFTQCDAICAKHGVTKIKTIGDSYMCVSFDSVVNAARVAMEMSLIQYTIQNTESNPSMLQFRIGVHCGPVTAGVIGKERMQYDVWGDTVNVASRMESSGEPGKVHVSEAFASNLKSNQESRVKNPISESHEVSHNVSHAVSHAVSHEVSHAVSHEVSHAVSHAVSHEVSHEVSHAMPLVTRHLSLVTTPRGSVDIKGKGPMQTYWLESNA
jgi:adenylate cyclase